ncbi:MAG: NAD(P)-dependent oxidoreductase [Armatimonadota bacterium]|nr:NAD(P)-dependent oxidoreductase [Armatimonadota bacterium]
MAAQIGFIGLGIMGRGMATNLINAGYEVTVYNRTRAKAEELQTMGARVADSPADAAAHGDIVFTMLADPPAVKQVILGHQGVIEGLKSGAILIDCSTVDPETTASVRKAVEAKKARFLDAPVAGSKDAAAKGELILMVGGEPETLEEAKPVLDVISKKIIHAGPSGSGTMLKLCFNLVVSHMMAALSESLVLGTKAGLSPQTIIDTLMTGVIGSRFYEWKGSCVLDRDFTTNFSLKLMHKDLSLISSAGYSLGTALPVTAAVKELYAVAKGLSNPDEDFCSVIKALEQVAQVEVKRS